MASQNIPVKIEFGGVDNVSPILGSINLKIGGITKQCEKLNETAKKLTFATAMLGINELNKHLGNLSQKLSGVASGLIEDVSNIEDNFGRIKILMGKSADTKFLDSLSLKLQEISVQSNFTQSQLSDVAKNIVSSGVVNKEDVKSLTQYTALLADASKHELSTEEAFPLLNAFKQTYGIKAEGIPKLADQMVYGKDLGAATWHDMSDTFKYVAPVLGATTNTGADTFLAMTAALSKHEIKGSNLGTALRQIVLKLVPNVDPRAIKRLDDAGLHDDALALKIADKGHNGILAQLGLDSKNIIDQKTGLLDLNKALDLISKNLGTISKDQRTSVIKQLFGQEAITAGLTLEKFLEDYKETRKKIQEDYKGKAQELADSTRDTLGSKINELKNAWENLKISFMRSDVNDSLKFLVDKFKSMTIYIGGMSSGWKNFIGMTGLVGFGILDFSAKLAPLLLNLYLLRKGFVWFTGLGFVTRFLANWGLELFILSTGLRTLIGLAWRIPFVFLTSGIFRLGLALGALALPLLANPLTWIVLGIVAAIATLGFAIYSLVRHWQYFKQSVKDAFHYLKDKVLEAVTLLKFAFKNPVLSSFILYKNATNPEFKDKLNNFQKSVDEPKKSSGVWDFAKTMTFLKDDPNKKDFSIFSILDIIMDSVLFYVKHRIQGTELLKSNSSNDQEKNKKTNDQASLDIRVLFDNPPQGTRIVQSARNANLAQVNMGQMALGNV